MYSACTLYHTSERCASTYRTQWVQSSKLSAVQKYVVTTSKLPAASTLYTKGILFAREEQIVAIKALWRELWHQTPILNTNASKKFAHKRNKMQINCQQMTPIWDLSTIICSRSSFSYFQYVSLFKLWNHYCFSHKCQVSINMCYYFLNMKWEIQKFF